MMHREWINDREMGWEWHPKSKILIMAEIIQSATYGPNISEFFDLNRYAFIGRP